VIIVFAGTDQDAEVIKFAQNDLSELGRLTAVLRSADDTEPEDTTGITLDQLVEDYGIPIPDIIVDLGNQNQNNR
jgi:pilus assembly protein CpaB